LNSPGHKMRRGLLSDYFEGVAVKRLSAVEADPKRSHQHEFQGGHIRNLMGDDDRLKIPARFVWLSDEQEAISEDSVVSWYDSRRKQPHRSAEYRLYYYANSVTASMSEGDIFFVAMCPDRTAMIIVTPKDSTIQSQLIYLFGLDEQPGLTFQVKDIPEDQSSRLDFAARYILDELGIDAEEPETDKLDAILDQYGIVFPATADFSKLARDSLTEVDPRDNADSVLMAWIEREELLFRRLERRVVADRLIAGFLADKVPDVDGFIAFSLSVQNRRKSRAGKSLEHHVAALFTARKLKFERGAETEHRNKPDFLFPGRAAYQDKSFKSENLTMLGAKSSCKDRWRQVLSEAQRIPHKHLLTLEPGISENQTDEMRAKDLQLILPASLHTTYREGQRSWLMNVENFVKVVQATQH
jgi:hypothetical protein